MVSMAGRNLTEIAGFHSWGIFEALKNNANHAKIGNAYTKNCWVNGTSTAVIRSKRIGVLMRNDAGNIRYTNKKIADKNV